MSNQLIMNISAFETRVALIENGLVTELFIERALDRGIVGNIYLGKVQRVLPGMQAAFVDIGLEKAAFLYVGDVIPPEVIDEEAESELASAESLNAQPEQSGNLNNLISESLQEKEQESGLLSKETKKVRHKRILPAIEEVLKPGQEVLIQVTKEPIGTKGPRVSCNISLPGQQLVFMPTYDKVGVSRKIVDETERERLKQLLNAYRGEKGGYVARTIAVGCSNEILKRDADFLCSLWSDIQKRALGQKAPFLIQPELDVAFKCVRDMTNDHIDKIVIDDESTFKNICVFSAFINSSLSDKIELYQGPNPIFDAFGVEAEITRAMQRKVWLRSGGYLVIDEAEALVVIDVNTGRFVGRRNLSDTILTTNLEAVSEVAYQLRLRNIGGMVIIDFIDMEKKEHQEKVLSVLTNALKKDRARCNVIRISELGLVEMTRQRTRESIERQLCEPCFYCDGTGNLKSRKTIAFEILRTISQKARILLEPAIIVHAHPEIVDLLSGDEQEALSQVESDIGKRIIIKPRGSFHQEHFDIFGGKPA